MQGVFFLNPLHALNILSTFFVVDGSSAVEACSHNRRRGWRWWWCFCLFCCKWTFFFTMGPLCNTRQNTTNCTAFDMHWIRTATDIKKIKIAIFCLHSFLCFEQRVFFFLATSWPGPSVSCNDVGKHRYYNPLIIAISYL